MPAGDPPPTVTLERVLEVAPAVPTSELASPVLDPEAGIAGPS